MRTADASHHPESRRYEPIGDYALMGDCQTAALVSRAGSIDWFCTPRFDGPSMFAAILDADRGGRFVVQPTQPFSTHRRYINETNVVETEFETATGTLRLTDAMSVPPDDHRRRGLWPDHEILRCIECIEGQASVRIVADFRPSYGERPMRLAKSGRAGHIVDVHHGMVFLGSEIALTPEPVAEHVSNNGATHCVLACESTTLRAGDRRWLSLTYADMAPAIIMPLGEHAENRMRGTVEWWQQWASRCTYRGPHRQRVVRSALALKLMAYAPSGAVIAAPTTSLPESIGGVRNWDYRYCWLRDALMTLRALLDLGYTAEAKAFISWTLHATAMSQPEVLALYDVDGESRIRERELHHLEGYMNSAPVRVGNAAKDQLQLDVYGAVAEAALDFAQRGNDLDRAERRMLRGLGTVVCDKWREPDEGIWEVRGGQRHHTLSKAMCWITLNTLLRMHMLGKLHLSQHERRTFSRERNLIKDVIESRGFNRELNSYVDELDGDHLDASLMLLMLYEYAPSDSPRMAGTLRAIEQRLREGGFFHRYKPDEKDDGLSGGEATFTLCGFWHVQCLVRQGRIDEAEDEFEHMYQAANDLGLFSEEFDPATGQLLGNFPQAYSHVGVIEAAVAIQRARESTPYRAAENRLTPDDARSLARSHGELSP